jgi:hypothetical protein
MFSHIEAAISEMNAAARSCTFFFTSRKNKLKASSGLAFVACGMLSLVIIFNCE